MKMASSLELLLGSKAWSVLFLLPFLLLSGVEDSSPWSAQNYPVSDGVPVLTSQPGPAWKVFVSSEGKGWTGRFDAETR
ncbi:MAG: hypothetical protein ACE5JA_09285, partial [bacterium]